MLLREPVDCARCGLQIHAEVKGRDKGKRGGLRVIYYWWSGGLQFWLFTVYNKDEMADLNAKERKAIKAMLTNELEARK